jgi:hypothetical protein
MKRMFKWVGAIAVFGLLATACSNETNESVNSADGDGETQGVHLTISTVTPVTRAAEDDAQGASAEELAIDTDTKLKVAVFNQGGNLVNSMLMTLEETATEGVYKTQETIDVTAGNLFFYVFANDGADKITLPGVGSTMAAFVEDVFEVAYAADGSLDIATANQFLLGTLWQKYEITPAGGTTEAPKTVPLVIGRLASKVNLLSVVQTSDNMSGKFTTPKYRLGTLALDLTQVGNNETANTLPYGTNKEVLVTSAKHLALPTMVEDEDEVFNSVDFCRYNRADDAFVALSDPTANENMFYATENTTGVDAAGLQYFGNTTYVQVETQYIPLRGEVIETVEKNATTGEWEPKVYTATPDADFTEGDGSFWIGYFKNERLLFSMNPATIDGFPVQDVHKYEAGLNYHKFVVFDETEPTAKSETRNRVLRNTYYEFKVTNFKDLGSWTSDVDPKEPVPAETMVDLSVTVKNWDKAVGEVEL